MISRAAIATAAIAMVLCPAVQASAGAVLPWSAVGAAGVRSESGRPLEQWLTSLTEAAKSLTVRPAHGTWTGGASAVTWGAGCVERDTFNPAGFLAVERQEASGVHVWSERVMNLPPPGR